MHAYVRALQGGLLTGHHMPACLCTRMGVGVHVQMVNRAHILKQLQKPARTLRRRGPVRNSSDTGLGHVHHTHSNVGSQHGGLSLADAENSEAKQVCGGVGGGWVGWGGGARGRSAQTDRGPLAAPSCVHALSMFLGSRAL